jgi:arginyl-tRNA synthetase
MPDEAGSDPVAELREAVSAAARALGDGAATVTPTLERPPRQDLGDYSTNAAMLLAPLRGEPPREIAARLGTELTESLGEVASRVEVAGPGFLNLYLADGWHRGAVARMLALGDRIGGGGADPPESILLEFVSANPTGPVTAAAGRHAAYGDSLARVLAVHGHRVKREYLLNDVGGQVERFAASIAARMSGEEPPEDGYAGAYVAELADEIAAAGADPADLTLLARLGTEAMRERIEVTMHRFRVDYDTWFSERSLHASGKVEEAIDELRSRGHVYESEGAVWLRTTEFGDDKDRVLIRAGGAPTYFAADIAYHRDKLARGAERLINPLGADHHGYVPRMRAALAALGADPDRFEAPMLQLVHIAEGGERSQMSKRKGQFVALDELVDDIGVDAARYFMLQRSHETTVDLDLQLARKRSQDNPVYYVQYAHARIASILRKAVAEGVVQARDGGDAAAPDGGIGAAPADERMIADAAASAAALGAPVEPAERALVKRLLELPGEVSAAAAARAPHRLCSYAMASAADFHAFYRDCQVVGAPAGTQEARLGLCLAAQRVIARTLDLLGVEAPERM